MSKFYPYGRQWIDDDDIAAVTTALKSDYLTGGPLLEEFEQKLAETVGAKYAVAVSNGTAALHIAYAATGLTEGDNIITTPFTFAATANAALYCNAEPVFADINVTGNINPAKVATAITPSTRIIAPVHYAGQPANMKELHKIAAKHDLFVIEDACHALGAVYDNSPIGSCKYSDMAVFSFHPVKHITTGEGGAITTNNEALYERLKLLRSHGIITPEKNWFKDMISLGFNYRLTELQAALGISQLKKLNLFIKERKRIASTYDELLHKNPHFEILERGDNLKHAYHLYPVLLRDDADRDLFMEQAQKAGIGLQVHYGLVYRHKYYQKNGYNNVRLPVAEYIASRELSLPIYPRLTDEDIRYIVGKLTQIAESI